MASRAHLKTGEVWAIVGRVSGLALDFWFGSKEKAEQHMSRNRMTSPSFQPVKLRPYLDGN